MKTYLVSYLKSRVEKAIVRLLTRQYGLRLPGTSLISAPRGTYC